MKKITILLGLISMVACTAPGGNTSILPEEHDPAHVPAHEEGAHHAEGEDEHSTEEHAIEKNQTESTEENHAVTTEPKEVVKDKVDEGTTPEEESH